MTKIVVATTNPGKLKELQRLIPDSIEVVPMTALGIAAPEETGATFLENATIKARRGATSGYPALADDSGLEVDALGGRPGVLSARFAGPDASDADNNRRLLEELRGVPASNRSARFRCAVALALSDDTIISASGTIEGRIIESERGTNGFGYDPLFEVDDPHAPEQAGSTLAETSLDAKNTISHRARAYRNLILECVRSDRDDPLIRALRATWTLGGHSLCP